jgi:hypothetical protein
MSEGNVRDIPRSVQCGSCASVVPTTAARPCGGCGRVICLRCCHHACRLCQWQYRLRCDQCEGGA